MINLFPTVLMVICPLSFSNAYLNELLITSFMINPIGIILSISNEKSGGISRFSFTNPLLYELCNLLNKWREYLARFILLKSELAYSISCIKAMETILFWLSATTSEKFLLFALSACNFKRLVII